MLKKKSKGKLKTYVKPEQLRDALVMTARQYRKTPAYQGEVEKRLEEFRKILQPQFESFEKMAKQINERIASSGLFEAIKKTEEVYSSFLKSYQPKIKDAFVSPRNYSRTFLTDEDIDAISEKAAEKLMEKIKADSKQNPLIKNEAPLIKLPPKTIWEDIEIRFKNQYDVEIYYKGKFLKAASYEKLGFLRENTKDKKPDKQWELLRLLAIIYASKEATKVKADINILAQSLKIERNACMKIKEGLSKKLQRAFRLPQNPFYDYKEKGEYRTRFILKPESEFRGNGEIFITKIRYDDNKGYLN
jgi:hypothetical protein